MPQLCVQGNRGAGDYAFVFESIKTRLRLSCKEGGRNCLQMAILFYGLGLGLPSFYT